MTQTRPIIMSGESVRAILDGRKTQTRRVVNLSTLRVKARGRVTADFASLFDPSGELVCEAGETYPGHIAHAGAVSAVMRNGKHLGLKPGEFDFVCPYASGDTSLRSEEETRWHVEPAGDRLWVREAFGFVTGNGVRKVYRADGEEPKETLTDRTVPGMKWASPIHMPRWASRLTLEITEVRLERVQEISEADAIAEGMTMIGPAALSNRASFASHWEALNAKRGYPWASNPWVWEIMFRPVEAA